MKYNNLSLMKTFTRIICLGWLVFCSTLSVSAQTKGHFSDKRLQADTSKAGCDGPYIFYEKENTHIYLYLFLCSFTCYDYWRFDINDHFICTAS